MRNQNLLAVIRVELKKLRPFQFEEVAEITGIPLATIRKIHYREVADPRIGTVQPLFNFFSNGGLNKKARAK